MLAAFEGLVVQPVSGRRVCPLPGVTENPVRLRSEPANVCRSKAQGRFGVNTLFRPLHPVWSRLAIRETTVTDRATGLIWQRQASRYPLTFAGAHAYVAGLNEQAFEGCRAWRLPTVDELLSLLPVDSSDEPLPELPDRPVKWLWSCDGHGHRESWYVNMDMGFAGTQDVNCLNHVRAVTTAP
jgi:serine/threonine-protein kinase